MTTYKTSELEAALLKKGFQVDETGHHRYWLYLDGKKAHVVTRTSHSEKEYDAYLFRKRRQQMRLTTQQFLAFIECRFTAENYRHFLLESGLVRVKPKEERKAED